MSAAPATRDVSRDVTPDEKLIATLQARAALAGYELVPMPTGGFVISWGFVRALADVQAVEDFLRLVSAR